MDTVSAGSLLAPPAGWYRDPQGSGGLRWWTGATWTDQLRPSLGPGWWQAVDGGWYPQPFDDRAQAGAGASAAGRFSKTRLVLSVCWALAPLGLGLPASLCFGWAAWHER